MIWDDRNPLREQYYADIAASAELDGTEADYRSCVAEHSDLDASTPAEVRAAARQVDPLATPNDSDLAQARDALTACEPVWADGYSHAATATAERFAADHATELDDLRDSHAGLPDQARADHDFLAHVGHQAAHE